MVSFSVPIAPRIITNSIQLFLTFGIDLAKDSSGEARKENCRALLIFPNLHFPTIPTAITPENRTFSTVLRFQACSI